MSCPDCFSGSVHSHAQPQGHFETLYGLNTYVAGQAGTPSPSQSTIIYLCDAFGLKLVNNKILADRYANETGCRVLVPDIIPGGGVSLRALPAFETIMLPGWSNPRTWFGKIKAMLTLIPIMIPFMLKAAPPKAFPAVLRYARTVKADLPAGAKLGVAGFCWGGYGSTNLCVESVVQGGKERLIDAQFCAHPSALKTPDMIVDAVTKYRVPYAVAVAEEDWMVNAKHAGEIEAKIRSEIGPPEENDYEFVVHKGCHHSFAVRANPGVKIESQGYEDAAQQAVNWFNKYL
ncbi:Alpha/Beta hydrolase protein [Xylariales sp. AK1849]|nr:Alpha/Beta hydrolase protein [Xylariales sp. AK1849]